MEKSFSNLAMKTEICEKITKFMKWDEFEFVDNWNELQPVISKVFNDWDDTAELLYDYHFIDIYNCVSVNEALPKVERCIDELSKRNCSVYGCVYEVTIENVAKYPELAKAIDNQQVHHCAIGDFVWIDQNEFVCSFHKNDFRNNTYKYCSDSCNNFVYGDTFEEMISELLTDMGQYTPSSVVNILQKY
jgi:hypothetical protein